MSTESIQPDPERVKETQRLKIGYFGEYEKRYPINTDPANSASPEDAYMLHLEKTNLEIPEYLKLGNIIDDIPAEHHERLINIWLKLEYHQKRMKQYSTLLQDKWKKPPSYTPDQTAIKIAEESITNIRQEFHAGAIALISKSEEPELQKWQASEKGSRRDLYLAFKNFVTALRAYYIMLLETGTNEGEYILPDTKTYSHIYRNEIATRNENLKIIDSCHQASVGAKAAHHEQGKSRLRKTENKPFVAHEIRTTMATILDVHPYATDKIGQITLIIASAIHDTVEDTGLTIDQIMEKYVKETLNFIDSSLIPHIRPGFEEKYLRQARKIRREQGEPHDPEKEKGMVPLLFQADKIHLVGTNREIIIHDILRIVSNNKPLNDEEKRKAYQDNIAGKQKTRELLNIKDKDLKRWRLVDRADEPTAKTFTAWPEEYDEGKLAHLLLRANTITDSNKTRRASFLVKIEDRADNINKLEKMTLEHQLGTLRATVTRLIAWCMLDYKEHKRFPLYNALLRLIDVTLKEYKRVQTEHPDIMQEFDIDFIEQLTDWKSEVIRFKVPTKVKKVLEEHEDSKNKPQKPTPSDSQLPLPYFET